MNKIKIVFAGLFTLTLFAVKTQAQTTPAPAVAAAPATSSFAGKWDVLVKGLPNGDTHMIFTLIETEGKLGGSLADPEGKNPPIPLTKVDKDDKGITLYFTANNYDVNLALQKSTDDDHVKGSLMGMFDATGERVK
ncbi:hypothetical protein HDF24_06885 [Mucilaginibacter sp. X4EP1]|uniref:hypothetical protein n=1 Tax=Mucilaginibacter sp. X4EP1 TaxID=2723092 RepID=UPI00216A387D|nr:hypothetical protein [Mucilaginibacter sp. X4EP1]MCS3814032.1 hypothetical protein [Mucilaginibacter sp. X4EP1]